MEISEINDKETWNQFLENKEPYSGSFLQSFEWGEFQKSCRRKIWRIGIKDSGGLKGVALVIKHSLPLGKSYLYIPKGPVFKDNMGNGGYEILLGRVQEIAKEENAIFFRIEPSEKLPITNYQLLITKSIQPADTLMLDLEKDEEKLMQEMKPKTRYNIRLAEKKGVVVKVSEQEDDIKMFLELLKITTERDKFKAHPEGYYKEMFKILGSLGILKLFIAEFRGKTIGANLMIFFAKVATYLHGALDYHYRDFMAPYLLHQRAIHEAKKKGYRRYDFWGIAPSNNNHHPWVGITRFKKGFGGMEVNFPGTFDVSFNNFWYNLYQIVKKIR